MEKDIKNLITLTIIMFFSFSVFGIFSIYKMEQLTQKKENAHGINLENSKKLFPISQKKERTET